MHDKLDIMLYSYDCLSEVLAVMDHMLAVLQDSTASIVYCDLYNALPWRLSGVTACITCFPLDLLRTRILADRTRQAGVIETLRLILRTEGPTALYQGLPAGGHQRGAVQRGVLWRLRPAEGA